VAGHAGSSAGTIWRVSIRTSAERIGKTRMDAFRRFVNQRHGLAISDYPSLHQWSIDQRESFWQAIVDFFEVSFLMITFIII
jgi:hypothetical protein